MKRTRFFVSIKIESGFKQFRNDLYIVQIQPEALDNIYSLLKQNIKWCNAKRRRQRRLTVKNNNRSNQQKKQLCTCSTLFCTFLCRCFARLQRENLQKLLSYTLDKMPQGSKIIKNVGTVLITLIFNKQLKRYDIVAKQFNTLRDYCDLRWKM